MPAIRPVTTMGNKRKWNNYKSNKQSEQPVDAGEDSGEKKNKPAPGDYPPPPVLESEPFESYYREAGVVPAEEWDAFITSLRTPLGTSFRITGHSEDPAAVALLSYMEANHISHMGGLAVDGVPIPQPTSIGWYPGRLAWRFDVSRSVLRGKGTRKNGGCEPATEAILQGFHNFLMAENEVGTISRQEEVSMVPPCLLDVQPGHRVIDMCASPGSKTQQACCAPLLLRGAAPSLATLCTGPSVHTSTSVHLSPLHLVTCSCAAHNLCLVCYLDLCLGLYAYPYLYLYLYLYLHACTHTCTHIYTQCLPTLILIPRHALYLDLDLDLDLYL